MDLDQQRRMLKNWRGRRYMACRTMSLVHEIIANLGVEDGSELPPSDSAPAAPPAAVTAEMQNLATSLLRLILAHNDGGVGPAKLQRF